MGSVRTGHAQVFPKYKSTLSGFRQAVMQFVIPRRREGVSQFDKNVIPGEPKDCGRDPESRKVAEKSNHSGSRLASRFAGFGRDDELRHALQERRAGEISWSISLSERQYQSSETSEKRSILFKVKYPARTRKESQYS
jgi:hypothetical protein